VLIEGNSISADETPSDYFLEHDLTELMAERHALSSVHIPLIDTFQAFNKILEYAVLHALILQENDYVNIFFRPSELVFSIIGG
jgi:hypothetical protein